MAKCQPVSYAEHVLELPPAVKRLLEERIHGLEHLELLMAMCRDERWWTIAEAAEKIGTPSEHVEAALVDLQKQQLVAFTKETGYRYEPTTTDLRDACRELRRLYSEDRLAIIVAIGHIAVERVRRSAARAFADAFRIKRPKTGGDSDA